MNTKPARALTAVAILAASCAVLLGVAACEPSSFEEGDDSGRGACAWKQSVDCGGGGEWTSECIPDTTADFCSFPASEYDEVLQCMTRTSSVAFVPGGSCKYVSSDDAPPEPPQVACHGLVANDACEECWLGPCCDPVYSCLSSSDCDALVNCVIDCSTDACVDSCAGRYSQAVDEYNAMVGCVIDVCKNAC